ncbi:SpnB-like Rossmann fold domain-containing protein, partial [Streptomyces alboverticillatus]|uniref:SpnB-like Rossmann fold domain-containing protein n=1 Tax=Streptomyces alboverticillatus TaxID=173770 RepID=UPI00117EA27E
MVVAQCFGGTGGSVDDDALVPAAEDAVHRALELIQDWLADERFTSARLVVVTRHAVAVTGDEAIDLATAPVWGLLRSAQSEHPGLLLLDVDDDVRSLAAVADAIEAGTGTAGETGAGTGEPQLALRAGRAHAPRLTRVPMPDSGRRKDTVLGGDGTVLIT